MRNANLGAKVFKSQNMKQRARYQGVLLLLGKNGNTRTRQQEEEVITNLTIFIALYDIAHEYY
jgi:hypothetical protein